MESFPTIHLSYDDPYENVVCLVTLVWTELTNQGETTLLSGSDTVCAHATALGSTTSGVRV